MDAGFYDCVSFGVQRQKETGGGIREIAANNYLAEAVQLLWKTRRLPLFPRRRCGRKSGRLAPVMGRA
jgi:hypothetical protein